MGMSAVMLKAVAKGLWERNEPLVVLGMPLGHRMTVVHLADGSLWVHSPVAWTPALADSLAAIGPVAHIIAPNRMHDTFLESWFSAYPQARFHGAPGLQQDRPDLAFTDVLGEQPDPAWAGLIDHHAIQGIPRVNEVVCLHQPSRTLIIADLAFNLGSDLPLLSRTLLRLNDCLDRFGPSRLFRSTIKDHQAFRASIDRVLAADFDRVLVGHGRNLDTGGKAALREAFLFLGG